MPYIPYLSLKFQLIIFNIMGQLIRTLYILTHFTDLLPRPVDVHPENGMTCTCYLCIRYNFIIPLCVIQDGTGDHIHCLHKPLPERIRGKNVR
jgi:hypothetical protein